MFRSTRGMEQTEHLEQARSTISRDNPPYRCSGLTFLFHLFRLFRTGGGTEQNKTRIPVDFLVPSVPCVPFSPWNETNIIRPNHQLMEVRVLRELREMREMYADAALIHRQCRWRGRYGKRYLPFRDGRAARKGNIHCHPTRRDCARTSLAQTRFRPTAHMARAQQDCSRRLALPTRLKGTAVTASSQKPLHSSPCRSFHSRSSVSSPCWFIPL